MIKLIKNADLYAPEHLGKRDILIADGRIAQVSETISGLEASPSVEVIDAGGAKVGPGYIDLHVHVTGGGGEQGFSSRTPDIKLTELTTAGVTTVVGLLGTDGVTRSLENLVAKTGALEEEGISTFMLTGSYSYPSVTLTGSVIRDITLIERIIGVKVAMSDHRSSSMTPAELLRLASDARMGGLISGKAGLLTIHMGDGKDMINNLFYAINNSDIPINTFLPTHCERNDGLQAEAVRYAKAGGNVDYTAWEQPERGGTARIIAEALANGAPAEHISMSSDGCGSQPVFDESGKCIGLIYTTPKVLNEEIKLMVNSQGIPLETALTFLTSNPAARIKKTGVKGAVAPGADADIIIYADDLSIDAVFAKGVLAVSGGRPVIKGRFEL